VDGRAEFIGENVEIVEHSDPSLRGICGMIVDETRETLVLSTDGGRKIVSKRPGKFAFKDGALDGQKIAYRPQDRIKKVKI
tara:strand:+ start:627 stop:869 length:243 start_codon:yes stop_codon:yes gene_type:complete